MAAKGARKWGVCGHTFHNISCTFGHFSCEIGGCFFGINKHDRHPARSQNDRSERGRHHTKGTRYVVNSLAALLGASAAIRSLNGLRLNKDREVSKNKNETLLSQMGVHFKR